MGTGAAAVTHRYTWQGSKLIAESYGSTELEFFYDENGAPYALLVRNTNSNTEAWYYYVTNLQGDVVLILDANGSTVAEYTYNAWGELLSASGTLADLNPIRYRGYYFDAETGFYYVSSRYYDPEICRFINADDASYLGANGDFISYNLFAYCLNNPVNMVDSAGNEPISITLGVAIGGVAILLLAAYAYSLTPAGQQGIQGFAACVVDSYNTVKTVAIAAYDTSSRAIINTYKNVKDELQAWAAKRGNKSYDDYEDEPSISRVGRQNGRAPRNNRNQNQQFWAIVKLLELTYDQARRLHDEITGMGYGFQEILQIARDMFRK